MAAPIIDSVTVTPDPVPEGESAIVRIAAHDPDATVVNVTGTATDSTGASSPFSGQFSRSDPLTYEAAVDVGHLMQDQTDPSVFVWTPNAPHDH